RAPQTSLGTGIAPTRLLHECGQGATSLSSGRPAQRPTASSQFRQTRPNTIITKARLVAELEQISQVGFAVDNEELKVGVHSIAVPVHGGRGDVIAAVDVAAPTEIVDRPRLVNDFGPRLQAAADELSAALGYRPSTDQSSED